MQDESPDTFKTRPSIFLRLNATEGRVRELAWNEFRDRYAPIIVAFARNLGATPQDIDDIIQTVTLGFFQSSPTFVYDPEKGRFRGYLKTCTFNAVAQKLGKAARFRLVPLDQVDPQSLEIDQAWQDPWEQQQLREALEATRAKYKDGNTFRAFEKSVILGQPEIEVAVELGMNVNSVYKAKERVVKALRETMDEIKAEFG